MVYFSRRGAELGARPSPHAAPATRPLPAEAREGCSGKGSCKDFCRSLKGRSASQTASTRVQELGIRYMRPFGTSLGHFYSYGTQVGMSILFHLIGRHEQIMPSSDQARSTGRPCRHMQLTNTCRGRILRKDQATKHA